MLTSLGKQGKVLTAQIKQEIRSLHYCTDMEEAKHFTLQHFTVLRSTTLTSHWMSRSQHMMSKVSSLWKHSALLNFSRQQLFCGISFYDSLEQCKCYRQGSAFIRVIWFLLYPYSDERRDIRSNIPLPRANLEGTPEGKGVYLTVYPKLSPNTDSMSF